MEPICCPIISVMIVFWIRRNENSKTKGNLLKFLAHFCITDVFSCKDLKDTGYANVDGEYYFSPQKQCDRPIKVYCHGLSTSSPKDFITLPTQSNFAVVYEKRMPFDKNYTCSGKVSNVVYSKSGTTRFQKVYIYSIQMFDSARL